MNKTIEISAATAQDLMPCLEQKLINLDGEITSLQAQYDSLKTTIAELRAKLNGAELPLKNGKYPQRFPKGHGDKMIYDLLESMPEGVGLTMAEIEEKTGINHATVYRTMKQPKRNNGRFVSKRGKWMLRVESAGIAEKISGTGGGPNGPQNSQS
jgi:hypothetical protein